MQYYDRFIEIVKQMSMTATEQIAQLEGTVVADELANDLVKYG